MEKRIVVDIDRVTMRFNMPKEKVDNIKEYLIKMAKRQLRFEEFTALSNVSVQIEAGEVVGIVGLNGSGKSTMLKLIAGILEPSEGKVTTVGSISPMIELGSGFDFELTAKENIFLNCSVLGFSREFVKAKYDEIMDFAELRDFENVAIKNFSSGMIARLGFAIATLVKPDILIVDEILSVGDFLFQQKCEKRISELMNGGTTVLIVSHSIEQIERLCTRVVWLENGVVKMDGETEDVCQKYKQCSDDIPAKAEEAPAVQEEPEEAASEEEEHESDWYKDQYYELMIQSRDLKAQNKQLYDQWVVIANSRFWKMTKPFRVTADFIKKILRKSRVARKIFRGLKYLKNHGLIRTVKRIFGKKSYDYDLKGLDRIYEDQRLHPLDTKIRFSILVPLYNTNEVYLTEMIRSVQAQTYPEWELCLADGSDAEHAYVERVVRELAKNDPRIKYKRLEKNAGISENTNACAQMATGEYLGFLDHDDLLSPAALYMNAEAILETKADVLYSDEDHLSLKGEHCFPFRKPDWSPDLLYSQMYICHFTTMKRSLFNQLGGFCSEFDGSQDYDLMLRISEKTKNIVHIPVILYTWRECETSTAANADAKPYAHEAGRRALDAHLKRRFGEHASAEDSEYTFVFDARFRLTEKPLVSIIMPMKDHHEMSDRCIESILQKSTYENYEILVLDNRSEKPETAEWFEKIAKRDPRIRVLAADMEFNWSKINNFGIYHAKGDVFIMLNNDTEVISPDWMERLAENAMRPDIGVVGGLLLYEDNTIQHAGVVIGMNGMADHVFKEMPTEHMGSPFVSPMVSRNVLAVTGACMAISRNTIRKIGLFDESFIICGSDVEICIRAYEHGLNNRYDVNVRLYHLESKSRDSYIPPEDFKYSNLAYQPYFEFGDPYYNENLNLYSMIPQESTVAMNLIKIKNLLKRFPPAVAIWRNIKKDLIPTAEDSVPEIGPIGARADSADNGELRLNLITPSVDSAHVFGGISTALKFFEELRATLGCEARIISTDAAIIESSSVLSKDYKVVASDKDSNAPMQAVSFNDRAGKTIPVRRRDLFMATAWWTAYNIREVISWQKQEFGTALPLLYMVQDYEPGFYPWSSRYMLADSTYRFDIPTYAIVNSSILKNFFDQNGYTFDKAWSFEPVLNDKLSVFLPRDGKPIEKKKAILVYGRPSIDRNAYALVVESLKLWAKNMPNASEWTVYSAGESHNPVDLGEGCVLRSLGKLSLEGYAQQMLDTYAGLSLMVSPHPSYPPLEMSTFGIKTVTNAYANKDLNGFNDNLIGVADCAPRVIAEELCKICKAYTGEGMAAFDTAYAQGGRVFGTIAEELAETIRTL